MKRILAIGHCSKQGPVMDKVSGQFWVIQDQGGDYWSNEFGWTEFLESATVFPKPTGDLPLGGEWVELESGLDIDGESHD